MLQPEASYLCSHCGEEIVVPIDLSAGDRQAYVEDCPVCCSPNRLEVQVGVHGDISLSSEAE